VLNTITPYLKCTRRCTYKLLQRQRDRQDENNMFPHNGGDVNITCIIDNKLVLFPSAEKETLDTLPNYTCF
jgi:hypothetical protein